MIPFWKKTDKDGKKKPQKPAAPRTAQQSIPMQRMFEDGTCRVKPNYYTRTIQYQDINYQLAQQEDKTAIFEEWCSFLNFFDSSIKFELSFVNMATDSTEFEKSIRIPFQKDGFDDVRAEYSQMLRQQLAKGNNGLTKTIFITFGVEGESMAQVKPRLDHIQNDLLNNFHRLGVQAKPLNGAQRLKLMHDMFNMDGASKFHFDWKDLVKSGLSVKDAIAPTAFAFKNSRTFQMGGIFCAASFLSITASDISDQLLKDFLDMDSSQIVTMHIQSVDQNKAIKTVKRTITELDRSKIEEQKKAIRAGYDIDIIPSDLATYGRDAKALLKELQSQNERMFLVTFLVLNTGRTEQELENNVFQASSIAQKHNCNLCRLDFQQEQGLMSSLPLADCQIEIQRGLTTSSTAIFIPFTTQELYQSGKESLYYGLNALSNNLIMVDRKKLKNPNGLILGTPGSGKSFSAKREITNAFLVTDDDIIICDPEAEYAPLVERLHGQVIHIGPASTQYINPMDINSNYSEEDNPLALKADFILSLCELVVGGKEGLQPVEKTVIDRCVHVVYRKYFENPTPENMPLLEDLYNALLTQDEPEARHVAAALEIYVKGSLNIFNHHTNVDIRNRIVCFDIKQLGKQLKKLGMLIVQDAVWGRVTANRSAGKSTRYYADEFHLLLKEEQTAAYSVEIWKRFRKWGDIPTALTQNVKDLLASPEVSNIFENSDFVYTWFEGHRDNIAPTTQESYKYCLKMLKEGFYHRPLTVIRPIDIENFLKGMRRDGRSDSYISKARGMLYQIFQKAEANDLVRRNPVRLAEKMRASGTAKRKEAFTTAEVAHLMKVLPDDRMGLSIRLLLGTGMRMQELLALEPQFIEEDGSVIHIRQAVKVVKGTVSIGSPKSKDSIRDIPVPLNVRPCAIKLRDTTDQFIWESPKTGLPCNPTHFRDVFRKSLEEAGDVRLLTPHSCRHTYVSQMQALGVDIQTIQSIVGHADTEMTEHYLHVQESIRQSAIQLFSEAFSA